ncbi:uncharacterized protein LOC117186663 [Drosophila miranda]|uniref:uncharacterized protein LOC117186663 n=1 Tax=Drosophila miranda TaxID=7229 RepID=UPI00143F7294|nr:uncharacterized protein LOC117186663 [Drosophila miranda]
MCESCEKCSNESCIEFFAVWNIIWGIIFFLSCIVSIVELHEEKEGNTIFYHVVLYIGVLFAALYTLSGIFILIGHFKDSALLFKCGLILSNPFPIWAFGTVFIPIVHAMILLRLFKVAGSRWN